MPNTYRLKIKNPPSAFDGISADPSSPFVMQGGDVEFMYSEGVLASGGAFAVTGQDVTLTGPSGSVIFNSDWGTATGTSPTALTDGGKWDSANTTDNNLIVVNAASEGLSGWPSTNALKVISVPRSGGGSAAAGALIDDGWALPAIGQGLYYRIYLNMDGEAADLAEADEHPYETTQGAGSGNEWSVNTVLHGTGWGLAYQSFHPTWPYNVWALKELGVHNNDPVSDRILLSFDTTYRIEHSYVRTGTDTWTGKIRVYASNGTLLYDEYNFHSVNGGISLGDWLDASNEFTGRFSPSPPNGIRDLKVGSSAHDDSEWTGSPTQPLDYFFWGALAIKDDWPGPYSGGV